MTMQRPTPLAKTEEKFNKINIMVIDGSSRAGELIKNILHQLGFANVFLAVNGFDGVRILKEVRIDLIFSDWELRVAVDVYTSNDNESENKQEILPINGASFVKRLRLLRTSPNPFVPIIMFIRMASVKDILYARDSGVSEIIIKPFDAQDLCNKITSIIESPRIFITAEAYTGPCRRRKKAILEKGSVERRKKEIRLVRIDETKK